MKTPILWQALICGLHLLFTLPLYGQDAPIFGGEIVAPHRTPALSLHSPTAYSTGYFGTIGMGGTFQHRSRLTTHKKFDPDLNACLDLGLGDPERWVGLNARINIYGTSGTKGVSNNLGEGSIEFHLSRKISRSLWLGAGVYDLAGWKLEPPNRLQSVYLTATKVLSPKGSGLPIAYLTAGVGNGRFRRDKDFDVEKEAPWGFFASAAVRILPEAHLIVEWTGYNAFAGFSVLPHKMVPMHLVLGVDDIFHELRKVVVGVSIGILPLKKHRKPGEGFERMAMPVPPAPQTSRV